MSENSKDLLEQVYNEGYSNAMEDVESLLHNIHKNFNLEEECRVACDVLIPVLSKILKESAKSIKSR